MNSAELEHIKGDIVIVDDTLPNLQMLSALLTEQGYETRGAPSGSIALQIIDATLPDLVLLDVRMPAMNGYEVCRRLKNNLRTCDIPIIFLSALDDVQDKVRGFEAGGVDYITKPFQAKEVLARVQTHLTLRSLQKQSAVQNAQLHRVNDELTRHREHLEALVVERTAALEKTNLELQQEITERKRTEKERERLLVQVQEYAQRIQQIINTVPEGVLLLDAKEHGGWHVTLVNPLGKQDLWTLAGIRIGEALTHLGKRPLQDFLTSPPTKGLWHTVEVEGAESHDSRHFQVIARPIETGPASGDWVMVIRDMTRQREIERRMQQQEHLATVGQLAAGIAHDFNNILGVITVYAQLAARKPDLNTQERERLEIINQQAIRASKLIHQILDFSRSSVFERSPLDLLPLLKEEVQLLQRTLPENIKVHLAYDHNDYLIHADPTRMQQMVMNLAINARDAMSEGGDLRIALARITIAPDERPPLPELKAGEWVRLTLTDTGAGIPDNVIPHIFKPFFTTKAPGKGTGLGLSQVHGIVGAHEGEIDVRSQVDVGTTFIIYLPALATPTTEVLTVAAHALPHSSGETLLLVEDNATIRSTLKAALESLNYRVLEAKNGNYARLILAQRADQIALVLSDVVMPDMGGVALFHVLRESYPHIPMILLTGHSLSAEFEGLQALGLRDWLSKPPDLATLALTVAREIK